LFIAVPLISPLLDPPLPSRTIRLIDLAESCVPIQRSIGLLSNYTECECSSATELFDAGVISCDDTCPEDCAACQSCFELQCGGEDVEDGSLEVPTSAPTVVDQVPAIETGLPTADEPFDLQNCEDYHLNWYVYVALKKSKVEMICDARSLSSCVAHNLTLLISLLTLICLANANVRLIDLAETCEQNDISGNVTGCECAAADALFDDGAFTCDDVCPEGCFGCEVCFHLECDTPLPNRPTRNPTPAPSPSPLNDIEELPDFDLQECRDYEIDW
jgi:hypothetical protein